MIIEHQEPTREDMGELDLYTVEPGGYLPWDCGECGRRRVEYLLNPTRLHCEKCRAVVILAPKAKQ